MQRIIDRIILLRLEIRGLFTGLFSYASEEEDYFHAKDYWQDYSPTASKEEDYFHAKDY